LNTKLFGLRIVPLRDQIKYIETYNANKFEIFREIVVLMGFKSNLVIAYYKV